MSEPTYLNTVGAGFVVYCESGLGRNKYTAIISKVTSMAFTPPTDS